MVDMGQADRTLYQRPLHLKFKMCWTKALRLAANEMGFSHYIDVPFGTPQDEQLRTLAHKHMRESALAD